MPYQDFIELPTLINERNEMDEHGYAVEDAVSRFQLSGAQEQKLLIIENQIIFKKFLSADLPRLNMEGLGLDQIKALQLAVDRWGNYFLFFQDFIGKVSDLITQNGGNLLAYQERAKKLLDPHRQLRTFIREVTDGSPFERTTEEVEGMLIDAVVSFVREKIYEPELIAQVQAAALKGNISLDAVQPLVDYIQSMARGGTISKAWAEYYVNLPGNVINAVPGNFVDPSAVARDDSSTTNYTLQTLMDPHSSYSSNLKSFPRK